METSEAADLIQIIAESIKKNPNQFNFTINISGAQAIVKNGGTGINIQTSGGGPGSQTIGLKSEVKVSEPEIEQVKNEMKKEFLEISKLIQSISNELRSNKPDKSKIRKIYDSLQNKWVPNLIIMVIGHILTNSMGI